MHPYSGDPRTKPMARNIVWGMDMTGIEDTDGRTKIVLGGDAKFGR